MPMYARVCSVYLVLPNPKVAHSIVKTNITLDGLPSPVVQLQRALREMVVLLLGLESAAVIMVLTAAPSSARACTLNRTRSFAPSPARSTPTARWTGSFLRDKSLQRRTLVMAR